MKFSFFLILLSGIFIFTLAVNADWTAPSDAPPTCPLSEDACNIPVNVSDQTQYKLGAFGVGGVFIADSIATFSGNVGIGTAAPIGMLEVEGPGNVDVLSLIDINDQDSNAAYLRLAETNYRGGFLRYDNTTNDFHLGVHNTNDTNIANDIIAMTIDRSSGNVSLSSLSGTGTSCLQVDASGVIARSGADCGGGSGLWTQNVSNIYYNSGNVGIGTANPSGLLVVGDDLNMTVSGNRITIGAIGAYSGLNIGEDSNNRSYILWHNTSNYLFLGTRSGGTTYSNTIVLNNGNVGLGITSPTETLDVIGIIQASTDVCIDGGACLSTVSGGSGYWDNNGQSIYNTNTGNVGIGIITTGAKLHVDGTFRIGGVSSDSYTLDIDGSSLVFKNWAGTQWMEFGSDGYIVLNAFRTFGTRCLQVDNVGRIHLAAEACGTGGSSSLWTQTGSDIYYDSGNVGIGTANPSGLLVVGDDLNMTVSGNRITIGAIGAYSGLNIGEDSNNRAYILWHNTGDYLFLGTRDGGTSYSNTIVLNDGNVGIGITSPLEKLHVSGNVRVTGLDVNTNSCLYADANGVIRGTGSVCGTGSGGAVDSVTGTNGVIVSPTTGNVVVSADTSYVQRIVSEQCNVGSSIRIINSDGTVICETDDIGDSNLWSENGSNIYFDTGNVGIGTNNPQVKLDVANGLIRIGSLPSNPAGVNGAMYYNTSEGKFKCYENNEWKDCISDSGKFSRGSDNCAVGSDWCYIVGDGYIYAIRDDGMNSGEFYAKPASTVVVNSASNCSPNSDWCYVNGDGYIYAIRDDGMNSGEFYAKPASTVVVNSASNCSPNSDWCYVNGDGYIYAIRDDGMNSGEFYAKPASTVAAHSSNNCAVDSDWCYIGGEGYIYAIRDNGMNSGEFYAKPASAVTQQP
ncbi:hypothetical protein ACFL3E_00265 [Patescibacteria group bacterium]